MYERKWVFFLCASPFCSVRASSLASKVSRAFANYLNLAPTARKMGNFEGCLSGNKKLGGMGGGGLSVLN